MSENHLITEFNQAIDLIITGGLSDFNVENKENRDLLALAAKISRIDYSADSKKRDLLKEQLLKILRNNTDELSDVELDYAAGGLDDIWEENDPKK